MVRKEKGVGERHMRILEILTDYTDKGYPPSIRQICDDADISSTSVVNYYLNQLEKWGYIIRDRKISRGIRLVQAKVEQLGISAAKAVEAKVEQLGNNATAFVEDISDMLKIPLVGVIGASYPLEPGIFNPHDETTAVNIARSMLPVKSTENLYALEVKGDSMIDAMVNDGDYVIMRPIKNDSEVHNGDMLAIYLPETNETTLKSFYKEKDGYRLQPANPSMDPIYISKETPIQLQGKVVMIFRRFVN